jgi:DNA polymerase I-like protein with 3'-5' exonuclease and polymerase domains
MARQSEGRIFTTWNQIRQDRGQGQVGTRSGRLSSTPNFQNISKNFEAKTDGYFHPKFMKLLPRLPLMRCYLLPDKGDEWLHRDFSQQELRVLAHYEDGPLLRAYNDNPKLDIHSLVQKGIKDILGLEFERTRVKTFVFQNVYGGGLPAVTAALGCDQATAKRVQAALMAVLPGYEKLLNDCKSRGALPIRTWGGREYHVEAPAYVKKHKRVMTFDYKRLNYLVQPSSADITKEAVIRYEGHPKRRARFLLTVHDELNSSSPKGRMREEQKILKEVMASIELDVPMLSDGKFGPNWGNLKDWED